MKRARSRLSKSSSTRPRWKDPSGRTLGRGNDDRTGRERMVMANIKHVAKIHSSPERIYRALTTAEDIRGWWTRDAVLDSRVGGTGEFGFFDRQVVARVIVDEL